MENTAQGRKRKLGSLACESTRKEKPIKTLDSSAAKLLIDGPSFWSKGKWPMKEVEPIPEPSSSTYKPCKSSPNALLTLRDAKSIRETIVDYLSPSSTAYSGLAEDVSSLMRALDDLLVSINAQTAKVVFRTREEALYRHGRAKSNAKKLKKQGKEFLRSFKKTVAVQAKAGRINAKEVKSLVKDVTEGVKEGIGQTLKIKRRETGYGRKEHGCGENGRSKGGTRAQRRAEKAEKRKFCREYGR
ncbi:uncharacterized protein EI90DRAFT_3062603 [Cantharellus anzutake]|uniref:uncharacterized protein n=1 Tax=Cantharellus anzutake TaxID=1750568 RepID=UPI001903F3EF|nr:uncharacterized protein EI90DRAFT_3062603 [Cantharellus anzutake]KAF8329432.1 hypothetical protein EI90DRAFT_3062603 [Cantharellus anzutake]